MRILLALLMLIPISSYAEHAQINCSTTNITTSYTTSSPGIALSSLPVGRNHFQILNPSTTRICVDTGSYSTTSAPAPGGPDEHCVAASSFGYWDFVTINSAVFIRADQSSCTGSVIIDVDVW